MARHHDASTKQVPPVTPETAPVEPVGLEATRYTARGAVPPVADTDPNQPASSASARAYDPEEPRRFVDHITSQSRDVKALAQALRSSGRDHDPAVLTELHIKLGDEAFAVIQETTAKAASHTTAEADKAGATVRHARPATTSEDGSAVHASSASIGIDGDAVSGKTEHATTKVAGDVTTTGSRSTTVSKSADAWTLGSSWGKAVEHGAEKTQTTGTASVGSGENGPSATIGGSHAHTHTGADKSTDTTSAGASVGIDKDGVSGALSASGGHKDPKVKRDGEEHDGRSHSSSAHVGGALGKDKQAASFGGSTKRDSSHGNGFNLGFNAEASRTKHQETHDGTTTLEIDTRTAVTASGGVHTTHAGINGSITEGKNTSFTASVPEAAAKGLDLKTLDPSHPEQLPEGASIRLDSAKFKGTSLGANIENLSGSIKSTTSHGTSLLIEKLDGHRVRIVSGPTEAISRVTSFGVDVGPVGVALLGSVDVSGATLHAAEYDLRTPEGQAAYQAFVEGAVPTSKTPGAENVKTIERVDAHASTGIKGHVGPVHVTAKGRSSEQHVVSTTSADGTVEVEQDATTDGRTIEHRERFDTTGPSSAETFTIVLENKDSVESLLKLIPGAKLVPHATEFRYELTPTSLTALYEQAQRAGAALRAHAKRETGNEHYLDHDRLMLLLDMSKTPEAFLENLHRLGINEFSEAQLLVQISDLTAGRLADNKRAALPGTLT